jgi:hypothetical protein
MRLVQILPVAFFHWCENVWPGSWLRQTTWIFAIVETIHIMVLAVLLGTVFIVDLRLLEIGMKRRSSAKLARDFATWTITSIILMFITGAMLFMSEATKLSANGPFFYKIVFLIAALVVQFTIVRTAVKSESSEGVAKRRVAACLSLFFWFGVAVAGRGIAFL